MRLQAFLRATAAPGREVVALEPFTAYFHPSDRLKYLNYAVPADDAEPGADEIERLRTAFRERDRLPRLEWVEEAAPLVAAALERAGMEEELRTPMLACSAEELIEPDVPGAEIAAADEEDLRELSDIQRVAFGGEPLGANEQPHVPSGGAVLARIAGEPVSAADWTPVIDGYSEIVGVATADAWRREGSPPRHRGRNQGRVRGRRLDLRALTGRRDSPARLRPRRLPRVATMLHWSDPA